MPCWQAGWDDVCLADRLGSRLLDGLPAGHVVQEFRKATRRTGLGDPDSSNNYTCCIWWNVLECICYTCCIRWNVSKCICYTCCIWWYLPTHRSQKPDSRFPEGPLHQAERAGIVQRYIYIYLYQFQKNANSNASVAILKSPNMHKDTLHASSPYIQPYLFKNKVVFRCFISFVRGGVRM